MFNQHHHDYDEENEMHGHHQHPIHDRMHGMQERRFGFRHGGHGGPFGDGPFGGRPFGDNPFGGGPFGEGPFGKGGPGRQRQRRGDIKYVLLDLLKDQPRHGYELIKALEEMSGGFYRPSPGLVYPTLQLLEDEGNLTSQVVDDKRVYTITEAGKKLLEQRNTEQGADWGPRWGRKNGMDTPQMVALGRLAMALFESVMQAARYGTPEQVQAVQTVLDGANKEVHSILAQSKPSETV